MMSGTPYTMDTKNDRSNRLPMTQNLKIGNLDKIFLVIGATLGAAQIQ